MKFIRSLLNKDNTLYIWRVITSGDLDESSYCPHHSLVEYLQTCPLLLSEVEEMNWRCWGEPGERREHGTYRIMPRERKSEKWIWWRKEVVRDAYLEESDEDMWSRGCGENEGEECREATIEYSWAHVHESLESSLISSAWGKWSVSTTLHELHDHIKQKLCWPERLHQWLSYMLKVDCPNKYSFNFTGIPAHHNQTIIYYMVWWSVLPCNDQCLTLVFHEIVSNVGRVVNTQTLSKTIRITSKFFWK